MDENTRFLIERMDQGFNEIRSELKELHGFRNRVLGLAMVLSGFVSLIIDLIAKR